MTVDDLISGLVRDLKPVNPLAPPMVRAGQWGLIAVPAVALALAMTGVRSDVARAAATIQFQAHTVLLLLATAMAAAAALVLAVPGERLIPWRARAPLLAAAAWGAWLAAELWVAAVGPTVGALTIDNGWGCVGKALAFDLVPGVALFTMMRRGAALDVRRAAMFAGLAVVGIGALGLEFACPKVAPMHLMVWHAAPALAVTLVTVFGAAPILGSAAAGLTVALLTAPAVAQVRPEPPSLELFYAAAGPDDRAARVALDQLAKQWSDSYTSMIIDLARLRRPGAAIGAGAGADQAGSPNDIPDPDLGGGSAASGSGADFAAEVARRPTRESLIRARLLRFLEEQTHKRFDIYLSGWRQWMWTLPYAPHPDYAQFKGAVYAQIDPRMQSFFPSHAKALIRLDEIDWGGVRVNGIPPLYSPKVLKAADARFLRDGHIVFGVVVHGEARAYPKRILAWHEMALDRLGDTEITVVYCTLCGTVIPYNSLVNGKLRRFGTSGLLYRSNKLMFDEETNSLWSTLEGKPVVGALVDTGLQMTSHASVTTTWGEWRAEHPDTTVLSLDTGFKRVYSEGAAYRDYFGHDRLYFEVSKVNKRLANKAEVLTLMVKPTAGGERQPVAIAADFLKKTPAFHFDVGGRKLVVVTSKAGANRVYDVREHDVVFQARPMNGSLVDTKGRRWTQSETALVLETGRNVGLPRYVAQRAFWFGWFAQYPGTLLLGR